MFAQDVSLFKGLGNKANVVVQRWEGYRGYLPRGRDFVFESKFGGLRCVMPFCTLCMSFLEELVCLVFPSQVEIINSISSLNTFRSLVADSISVEMNLVMGSEDVAALAASIFYYVKTNRREQCIHLEEV